MAAIFAAKKHNPQQWHWVGKFSSPSARPNIAGKLCALGAITMLSGCQTVIPKGGKIPVATASAPAANADDGRHKVALLLPMTGPNGDVGRALENAAKLALSDTKNTLLNVKTYNTASGAASAARQAMADGNRLILGPLRGDNVVTVAGIAQGQNVPIISYSNDIGVAAKNVYLLGHLPHQSVDRIIRFAKSRGLKRFAAIVPDNVYGQRVNSNFIRSVRAAGGKFVSAREISGSNTSIDSAADALRLAGGADAVLIAFSGNKPHAIASSLRSNGMENARILGTDLWNINGSLAGNSNMHGAWFASVSDGYFHSFANNYRAKYGKAPLRLASLGYDSILLTMRVAQNWKPGKIFPVKNLIQKDGFIGVDGAFRFTSNGMSERMLEVQEIQPGKFVTIDAAAQDFPK